MVDDKIVPLTPRDESRRAEGQEHCKTALGHLDRLRAEKKVTAIYAVVFDEGGNASIIYGGDIPIAYLVYSLEVAKDDLLKGTL